MGNRTGTFVSEILGCLIDLSPRPFETPYGYLKRLRKAQWKRYYDTVYQLQKRGVVNVVTKNGAKFIQLTRKGYLEMLMQKAMVPAQGTWDGKWRILMFDIPESAKKQRDWLRLLLKQNGFRMLQASVFINPFPLNHEAITYLKETGLIEYIRVIRADALDDDGKLRTQFKV